MANYRQIHVSIWKDDWFLDLDRGEKLFFIYLFSNESASLSGLYKIALRVMAFETGLDILEIQNYLDKFERDDKVYYRNGVVWVKNLRKYNQGGATVQTRIEKDIQEIPYCELKQKYIAYYYPNIPYQYPTDSLSYEMKRNEMNGSEDETAPPSYVSLPTNALEASKHPDIKLFQKVSGVFPGIGDYKSVIDSILYLRKTHTDEGELESYLLPFWLAWDSRKTKDGNPFKKTNISWLTEWAVNNTIPPFSKNGNEQKSNPLEGMTRA